MPSAVTIEPVPPPRIDEALLLLVGGDEIDFSAPVRVEALRDYLQDRGDLRYWLWWAQAGPGRPLAAAGVIESAGNLGILVHSPPPAGPDPSTAMVSVIQAACGQALKDGLAFVQALVDPRAGDSISLIVAAGFGRLAELVHMELLTTNVHEPRDPRITCRRYEDFAPAELADVIGRTYEQSLDCPALSRIRRIDDVIASHKASGLFRPESWWIVQYDGQNAGCVLMNESLSAKAGEIVYLGLLRPCRGKGLGKAMVRRAAAEAFRRGWSKITLAVDSRNIYAKRLYDAEGFKVTHRALAYILCENRHNPALP
ncbi:MAG: GNAT family N-acetyltransferase [Phycisphaerae bacterium]|jgi:ribosomal protein S18 acetylase RimI-like enzyme